MMKKILIMAALSLLPFAAVAQTTAEEYLERYNLLSSKLGLDGVGIETLLTKWEEAYPDDENMISASFLYYYTKCQTSATISSDKPTYLGKEPIIELKDSLGKPVYYFEDIVYDDEMFGKARQYIEKLNSLHPEKLENRLAAITALVNYEKGSPDMALSELNSLVDYNYTSHPSWTYSGNEADDETFKALMQDYCITFFRLGTPSGYEAFRSLSEKMLQYNPNNVLFLDNIGSYYLVGKKDNKNAQKYYDKVLKLKPDDITAIKNCIVMARTSKNTKLEKKYLPMMIKYGEDDASRKAAEVRLKYLNSRR